MTDKQTSKAFWEQRYATSSSQSSGLPSSTLVRFAKDLPLGQALELGCARGDDAVWLASLGWVVTAVDISESALKYALANAERSGVSSRITFAQHDLSTSFPTGSFDLVTASFLESPVNFGRSQVLQTAAGHVARGGVFLITSHGSSSPWSWPSHRHYPSPEQALAELNLDMSEWEQIFVGNIERQGKGPGGQTAMLTDTVVALRRRLQQ